MAYAGLKAHPHMLRHACGYALANKGHDTRAIQGWLGHRSITSTLYKRRNAKNLKRPACPHDCLGGCDYLAPGKRFSTTALQIATRTLHGSAAAAWAAR